jgi:hypothetical protein
MTVPMTRRDFLGASLSLPLVLAATPVMVLGENSRRRKLRFEQTLKVSYPAARPKDWEFFLSQPPTLPGYQDVSSCIVTCPECPEMVFREIKDTQDQRVILVGSMEGKGGTLPTSLTVVSTVDTTLYPVNGAHGPTTLTPAEQLRYTKQLPTLDFRTNEFMEWCKNNDMVLGKDENIADFGRRVTDFVYHTIPYGPSTVMRLSEIVTHPNPYDCGGHASIPVGIFRANLLPSRILAGWWSNGDPHAKCEVFDPGYGWVVIDATNNLFGIHNGDHYATCIDTDFTFPDFPNSGHQVFKVLQTIGYYIHGPGSVEGKTATNTYKVIPLP